MSNLASAYLSGLASGLVLGAVAGAEYGLLWPVAPVAVAMLLASYALDVRADGRASP